MSGASEVDRPPDLVLFLTDQQRSDQLERWDPTFETPHLTALASRGTLFADASSGATTCVPARSALLTGRLHPRCPTQDTHPSLPEGAWTVARALYEAGYQTALVGKMHFRPIHGDHGFEIHRSCEDRSLFGQMDMAEGEVDHYHQWLVDQGHPLWNGTRNIPPEVRKVREVEGMTGPYPFPAEYHQTEWIQREAASILASRDPDRPLFLVVSFLQPHQPHQPPEPYASRFVADPRSNPIVDEDPLAGYPPGAVAFFGPVTDPGVVSQTLALVRALVCHIDDAIGRLLDQIPLASAVVAFSSDHGDFGGHRGRTGKLPWIPLEDLCRVPLIVAGGDFEAGATCRDPVQSFDLVPTFLRLAGVAVPAGLDGRDLAGPRPLDREILAANNGLEMIRHRGCKLITAEGEPMALFNLEEDPGERQDLAADPAWRDRRDELQQRLVARLAAGLPSAPFVT